MSKDVAFWLGVALAGVAGVALFKVAAARLPVPDGLNQLASAL